MTVVNGQLILIGGLGDDGQAIQGGDYAYDPRSNTWTSIESPLARFDHSATALPGGKLVVFGGRNGLDVFNDAWIRIGDSWEEIKVSGEKPNLRYGHMAVHSGNDTVIVFGGREENDAYLNDVWMLNVNEKVWRKVDGDGPAPLPRAFASAAPHDGGVLLYGGSNENVKPDLYEDLWVFE